MDWLQHFSASYCEARGKFLQACDGSSTILDSIPVPETGPDNNPLFTDAALFGPRHASSLLVIISGTHGLEGLCGSGCQVGWIREFETNSLPPDTAVLLIHLLNPYGTTWQSRFTEEGVDLNRNFMPVDSSFPDNRGYEDLHDTLMIANLEPGSLEHAETFLNRYREEHGQARLEKALWGGQYSHADGNNFGGLKPVRARLLLEDILKKHAGTARRVAVIDIHTGLGPFGYGMPICSDLEGTEAADRLKSWYGEAARIPGQLDEITPGDVNQGCAAVLADAQVTAIALEFGTYSNKEDIRTTIEALWLRNFGDPLSKEGRRIRQDLENYYYPKTHDWKEMVWVRYRQVVRQALTGLSS